MNKLGMGRVGICAAALVVGCGDIVPVESEVGDTSQQATYVGSLDGTDALIALTVEGDRAFAYTCGGDADLETHTMWFGGDVFPLGDGYLYIDCGDFSLTVQTEPEGTASGFAIIDGQAVDFSATRTAEGTIAGLYKDRDPDCATGAIILQDSPEDEPFVQGAWCNGAGSFAQVTPMSPVQLTAQGLPVEIPIVEDRPTERFLPAFSL